MKTYSSFKEIYEAVDKGIDVYVLSDVYTVKRVGYNGRYLITCSVTRGCIGLYEPDYKPSDFYTRD